MWDKNGAFWYQESPSAPPPALSAPQKELRSRKEAQKMTLIGLIGVFCAPKKSEESIRKSESEPET